MAGVGFAHTPHVMSEGASVRKVGFTVEQGSVSLDPQLAAALSWKSGAPGWYMPAQKLALQTTPKNMWSMR